MSHADKQRILCEEIEWQLKCGQGWWQAMTVVGYTNERTLARRLHRAGRPDLAAVFEQDNAA